MLSYHVFFNPKPDVSEEAVIASTKRLMADLLAAKQICSHRLLKVTNPASSGAPRFQAIFDYDTQAQLDGSLAFIGHQVHSGDHGDFAPGRLELASANRRGAEPAPCYQSAKHTGVWY